jgi:hypothetical protein
MPGAIGIAIPVRPVHPAVPSALKHKPLGLLKGEPETRRAWVRLQSGTLVATADWAVNEYGVDVLRGYIEYRPDADQRRSCPHIRFIQVAKVQRNGGFDYNWQGLEKHRNLLRTSSEMGPGIKDGYFVEHMANTCEPGASCSPYFRDYWANATESEDGFQLSGHSAPASLVDYPFGWEIMEQISLESCARCVESGEFLGCADWGARWPLLGQRRIALIRVDSAPSKTFLAALRKFEEFYSGVEVAHSFDDGHSPNYALFTRLRWL